MKWKLVSKDSSRQPDHGSYSDWKELIAEECEYQCVYCSIHEQQFGGIDHYHIDHYRPKSKFEELENDILNLFYSCPICNRFKSDDWPSEPDNLDSICYPNPSEINYSELFRINEQGDFTLTGNFVSSNYLIERLFLNRAQLLFERREYFLSRKERQLFEQVKELETEIDNQENIDLLLKGTEIRDKILNVLHRRKDIRPYEKKDIKKG